MTKKQFFLIIFLSIIFINSRDLISNLNINNKSEIFQETRNSYLSISYNTHNPIKIIGDVDFHQQAESEGWDESGARNGTYLNPYLISGYNIMNSYFNLIEIRNVTVYFQISNNYLNCDNKDDYGILLVNVIHGNISNNHICNAYAGISLQDNTNNITIMNNSIYQCDYAAIYLSFNAQNNSIHRNEIFNNTGWGGYGLYVEAASNDNNISTNVFYKNRLGIRISTSFNYVWGNTIFDCTTHGIYLYSNTYNNVIFNNTVVKSGEQGIYVYMGANNNTVVNNTVAESQWYGIQIASGSYNNITCNNVYASARDGIRIRDSINNTVTLNSIYENNWDGIRLYNGDNNIIENNSILVNTDFGVNIDSDSTGNIIKWNDFFDNRHGSTSQGHDTGINNNFSYNYWFEWTTPDSEPNGIVDIPYQISGGNNDSFPLTTHQNIIRVHLLSTLILTYPYGDETLKGIVRIQWEEVYDFWQHPITYSISYRVGEGSPWILIKDNIETTFYDWDTRLVQDEFGYQIQVKASCSEGLWKVDSSYSLIDILNKLPSITQNPDVQYEEGIMSYEITWEANDDNPTNYTISKNGDLIINKTWDGSNIIFDVGGLSEGNYTFICSVFDEDGGNASSSLLVSVILPLPTTPSTTPSTTLPTTPSTTLPTTPETTSPTTLPTTPETTSPTTPKTSSWNILFLPISFIVMLALRQHKKKS